MLAPETTPTDLITKTPEHKNRLRTLKGYKVSIGGGAIQKREIGVYILDTHTIKFKKIEIIAEIDNYFIVKEQDRINDEKYYEKLGLFDVIVVSGKDFYQNKFISY